MISLIIIIITLLTTTTTTTTTNIIIVMIDVWGGFGSHDDGFATLVTNMHMMFTICVHTKALSMYVCMYGDVNVCYSHM